MDESKPISKLSNNPNHEAKEPPKFWAWLNIIITVVLFAAGLWYLVARVSLVEVGKALGAANPVYILLSLTAMVLTLLLKAWRWQMMFPKQRQNAPWIAFFWSLMLGAYINVLVPFLRLGELARIVSLDRLTGISKAQSLATLVLEKTLELIMLGLTLAALVTAVALPAYLNQTNTTLLVSVVAVLILLFFYLVAAKTELVTRLLTAVFTRLPEMIGSRLTRWTISGLEGLSALRDKGLFWRIIGLSLLIAILAVMTPWLLLVAFHLPFGLVEAAIIHIAITVALVPPTTPGKIGIFDGVVAFLLLQFGLENEAVVASYTIVFHLIVILPMVVLGSVAASRTNASLRKGFL